jgi:hypothetical protein
MALSSAVNAKLSSVSTALGATDSFATLFAADVKRETRDAVRLAKSRLEEVQGTLEDLRQLSNVPMAPGQRDTLQRMLKDLAVAVNCVHKDLQALDRSLAAHRYTPTSRFFTQRRNPEVQAAGLQEAMTALKAAGDAVRESITVVLTGRRAPSLYQAPRQLQQVVEALTQGNEVVVVTGGPALGKSALAREVMRRINEGEVRSLYPGCKNMDSEAGCV